MDSLNKLKVQHRLQTIISPYKKAIEYQCCCISYVDFVEQACIFGVNVSSTNAIQNEMILKT